LMGQDGGLPQGDSAGLPRAGPQQLCRAALGRRSLNILPHGVGANRRRQPPGRASTRTALHPAADAVGSPMALGLGGSHDRLTDPQGKLPGWQHEAGDHGDRDLKFLDVGLAFLKTDYAIDENRIYATGHSNGGGFPYLLWARRPDVFAAFAPSAAGTRAVRDL